MRFSDAKTDTPSRMPKTTTDPDRHHELEWSDLSLILAICRSQSVAGASRVLGKTRSTVLRNINAIEERTGVRFFDRFDHGYVMTDAGRFAMEHAERVEAEVMRLETKVLGQDRRLSGRIRLTCMDAFSTDEAPAIVANFRKLHPEIQVDISSSLDHANLGMREAEIAVRATKQAPETAVGRKVSPFRFALYSTEEYLAGAPDLPLSEHQFCFVEGMIGWLVPTVWESRDEGRKQAAFQCPRAHSVLNATALGMGITIMPCYAGDQDDRLIRVSDPISNLDMDLWVLTHPDLRNSAKVQAMMSFLYNDLGMRQDLWSGGRKQPGKWNFLPRED